MSYGVILPSRPLPEQNWERLMVLANRWNRADAAHAKWAEAAKKCVEYVEGQQWSEEERAFLAGEKRPALVFNMIKPLVFLVLGYHRNNRTDTKYLPGSDGTGDDMTAEALTRIAKQIAEDNDNESLDAEQFADGIMSGRGFKDSRLSFEDNVLGEIRKTVKDPFSIRLDPDGDTYDLNKSCGFTIETRWTSPDEIDALYGREAANLIAPLAAGSTPTGPIIGGMNNRSVDTAPVTRFGGDEDNWPDWWSNFNDLMGDFTDPIRKNVRMLDFQYWVRQQCNVFVDQETGDRSVIPEDWDTQKIQKCLYHAQQLGNPLLVTRMPMRRVRWTTVVGDLIVYDNWSPYDRFTLNGFFPYFRRGVTRGMVNDLIDPQDEINKRRSSQIEMVQRTTHGGWSYHESAFDAVQEANVKKFGSTPGVHIKWKGDKEPKRIEPGASPIAMEKLEAKGQDNLRDISGINESALGELDRVQSGRAIEARQRQAVIALQVYLDNFSRTKRLEAKQDLSLMQGHYTEERIYRILGENGEFVTVAINKQQFDATQNLYVRINDITAGKYRVSVDETPLSASFASAQFEEALAIIEKITGLGVPALPFVQSLIKLSSLPDKEKMLADLAAAMGQAAPPVPGGPVPPPQHAPVGHNGGPSLVTAPASPGGAPVPVNPGAAPAIAA